jgi:hypothetical protein
MFIKILTPNHNGKIELTVRDLEALIQEAVDKAVSEKCANCNRDYWYNYCDSNSIRTYPNIAVSGKTESNVMDNIAYLNDDIFEGKTQADLAISYKKADASCLTHTTGTIFTNATKGE